jgi:2-phospho-L-lactate/phosphoenolpyruvate guanylyltransferase
MDAGLLPVKRLDTAKRRLLPHVSEEERFTIARALLEDSLDLCASVDVLQWWVVSEDESVRELARSRGFALVDDPGDGLNSALNAGIAAIRVAGAGSVTIIPADVPLAWSGDIHDILDTGATSDVVAVPSRDGGTNALYLSPVDVMPPAFGHYSFKAHLAEADRLGLRCTMLPLPRLELDIDTIDDVDAYLSRPKAAESRTSAVLGKIRAKSPNA